MAKRRKQHRKRSGGAACQQGKIASGPQQKIWDRAEGDLEIGNVRRAREGFRRLVKLGVEGSGKRYLEVTELYLEELRTQQRMEQVRDILNQTRRLLGEEGASLCQGWEKRLGLLSGRPEEGEQRAWLDLLEDEQDFMSLDAVVLGSLPAPEGHPLAEDVEGIRQALAAVAKRDGGALDAALKGIGRRSPLVTWKWLLKGWGKMAWGILASVEEREAASRCFLQAERGAGIPAKGGAFMLGLLGQRPLAASEAPKAALWLADKKLAEVLLEAERSWRRGDLRKSYESLQKSGGFPCVEPFSLRGDLSRLFATEPAGLGPETNAFFESQVRRVYDGSFRSVHEQAWMHAWTAHVCPMDVLGPDGLERHWKAFLSCYERLYGPHPGLESYVWEEILQERFGSPTGSLAIDDPEDLAEITRICRAALQTGPPRRQIFQTWLGALLEAGEWSAYVSVLEEAIAAFPKDVEFLSQAGREAVRRNSITKAVAYLKKVIELNPLARGDRAELLRCLTKVASKAYARGRFDLGRIRMEEARGYALDNSDDPSLGVPYLNLEQAAKERYLVESKDQDASLIERCEATAKAVLPEVVYEVARYCFEEMMGRSLERSRRAAVKKISKIGPRSSKQALLIAELLHHHFPDGLHDRTCTGVEVLTAYLNGLSKSGDIQLVELRNLFFVLHHAVVSDLMPMALVKRARRQWPESPLFPLILIQRKALSKKGLKGWLEKAQASRDPELGQFAQQVESEVNPAAKAFFGGFADPFGIPPGLYDDEEDEDDEDDILFGLEDDELQALKVLPNSLLGEFAKDLGVSVAELRRIIEYSTELRRSYAKKKPAPAKKKRAPAKKKRAPANKKPAPAKKNRAAAKKKNSEVKKKSVPSKEERAAVKSSTKKKGRPDKTPPGSSAPIQGNLFDDF